MVRLRRWGEDDVPALVGACSDKEIARWTLVPYPYTREDAHMFLALSHHELEAAEGVHLAVTAAEGGELLGSVALRLQAGGRGDIGYWTAAAARGRGVATRAVRLIAGWGFDALALERIEIQIEPGNEPSLRVARRAGFSREGVRRSFRHHKGRKVDVVLFSRGPG